MKPGYSDGEDVGNRFVRPDCAVDCGKRLSVGAAYTVSRPAGEAFPDTSGKVLTDGYVSLASYWGLGDINLTGDKNVKRVGELVVWEAGEPVVVTVDLGKTHWEDCFFPPADELQWEGTDSPLYADLPAGGILDHKFAVCFEKPVEARHVRFTLAPPTDRAAGIGLWELEVYDRLEQRPWSDRLRLPD